MKDAVLSVASGAALAFAMFAVLAFGVIRGGSDG